MNGARCKAFSMIELLVVLVILAVLAAQAMPSYQQHVIRARRAEGQAALLQLMQQEERFFTQTNTYIAFSAGVTEPEARQFKWWSSNGRRHGAWPWNGRPRACTSPAPNPRIGCVIVRDGDSHRRRPYPAGGPGACRNPGPARRPGARPRCARRHRLRHAGTVQPLRPHAAVFRRAGARRPGRVVAAMVDPNPLVAGQGLAKLEAAGIEVSSGRAGRPQAYELNIGFFSRMQRGRPWVRLKTAASLDGMTALHNGESQWITGPKRAPTATPGAPAPAPS
jgi:prepilin-type N-terminal cleavage/methylation domain-containing protein